jgi:arsenate reductase
VPRAEGPTREHEERRDKHPLRPEVALSPRDEPDEDCDEVEQRVLEGERPPAGVVRVDALKLGRGELAKHRLELRLGARFLRLVQALLKLFESETSRLVVDAELTDDPGPVGVGNEQIGRLRHTSILGDDFGAWLIDDVDTLMHVDACMNVLFVCVANSGRSVMAERLFRRAADRRHEARSAGSQPGDRVHPHVVEALREVGVDASDHRPSALDHEKIEWADVVVATCDDACPVIPGKRYISWNLPDPKNLPLEEVRPIRDEIEERVAGLVDELDRAEVAL